jgi:hypothetical protein
MRNEQELAHMIALVITGGQTGADQSGWRAAKAAGISTGGIMPPLFMTEAGPRPEFAGLYGATAMPVDDFRKPNGAIEWVSAYRVRTRSNVCGSDATLWLGNPNSPGGRRTRGDCTRFGKPVYEVPSPDGPVPPDQIAWWIKEFDIRTLNIAGNRETSAPGIGEWAERYLTEVFRLLRATGEPAVLGRPSASPPSASPAAPPHTEDR